MFQGFVGLGETFPVVDLVKNDSGVPINLDAIPTYRVYGPDGLLTSQTGSMAKKDSGTITAATNASPIAVTSVAHGLSTGTRVTITGALGNTAANGTFTITKTGADTFTLDSSTGNGAWTSGGTWNVTGLYQVELDCLAGSGYEAGVTYTVLVSGAISGSAYGALHTFTVT